MTRFETLLNALRSSEVSFIRNRLDVETIKRGLNFTLRTSSGDIDLLGELTGVGTYADVLGQSVEAELFGSTCRFINLDALIRSKRAAGRAKDLEVIAELEAIREQRRP